MEVFAVAPGYVWRIRVSGSGYGRALYIRLDDGRTAVYAHLNDFVPRIEEVVKREQRRVGKYRIDYILPDSWLRVSRGELIAHSGESGAGPPHLHFELRKGDVQINPMEAGVEVADARPPRIRSLILIPLGPHSMVDGRPEPLAVGLRWDRASSTYRTSRVPRIEGDVAVACRVYDLADGKPNKLAPYGAALLVDGVSEYDLCFDAVALEATHHVEYVYNFDYARRGGRNVLNLYCAPGRDVGLTADETPMRGVMSVEGSGRFGSVALGHGVHGISVEAWDFAGNRRSAHMDVVANNPPALLRPKIDQESGAIRADARDPDGDRLEILVESSSDSGGTWSALGKIDTTGSFDPGGLLENQILRIRAIDRWSSASAPVFLGPGLCEYAQEAPALDLGMRDGYMEAVCRLGCPSAHAPELWLVNGDRARPIYTLKVERTGPATFRAAVPLSDSLENGASLMAVTYGPGGARSVSKPLRLTYARRGVSGDLPLPEGALLAVGEGTFAEDAFVMSAFEDSFRASAFGELVPMGRPYRCDPPTQFFEGRGTLYLPLEGDPANRERVGIYQKSGERSWRYVGAKTREGGLVGGDISHFSVFALMEDVEAPRVTRLRPRAGAKLREATPMLEARLRDKGSGLDWDKAYFTIDGERLITAWEAERGKAWVRVPHKLSPGAHSVVFHAADRAGNETAVESTFYVVR
jgi:hypothetical protein